MKMTIKRCLARVAALTVPVAALVAVAGTPAHAGLVQPSLVAPQMTLSIVDIHGVGFHVCGFGSTPATATYKLDITGARSNGSVISLSASHTGTSAGNCLDVTEDLTPSGEFNVTFTVSATAASRAGVAVGGGTWDLAGEQSWDTA